MATLIGVALLLASVGGLVDLGLRSGWQHAGVVLAAGVGGRLILGLGEIACVPFAIPGSRLVTSGRSLAALPFNLVAAVVVACVYGAFIASVLLYVVKNLGAANIILALIASSTAVLSPFAWAASRARFEGDWPQISLAFAILTVVVLAIMLGAGATERTAIYVAGGIYALHAALHALVITFVFSPGFIAQKQMESEYEKLLRSTD